MANNKVKKKWYQKWWIWAIIVVVIFTAASGGNNDDASAKEDETTVSDINEIPTDTTEDVVDEQPLTFELVAGEQGEYGEIITVNKDTEFEETFYIYHIPAGTYKVTNTGEYMNQFNVYSDEYVVNEDGWEEIAEAYYVKVLKPGESDTFTIEDGQHVDICEPGKYLLEKNK